MNDVRGKRALVVGLAKSGRAVALALRHAGATVTVTDLHPPSAFADVIPELLSNQIGLELGSQRLETFLRHDLVVVSPGVPWGLSQLQAARERHIPVFPEVEVASWFLDGTLVGVTGSNGKTTTVTLLARMLEASRLPTFLGGNVGTPLSLAAGRYPPDSIFVTELSSFQLEAIQDFRPHVAVFLNLSPNHLDRHPSFEAYAQAKRQIFRNQRADDFAVLNADDPRVSALAPALASRKIFFSRQEPLLHGVFVSDGHVMYRVGHLERPLFETREVRLRGAFNLEDVLAATAAACLLGADFEGIRRVVRDFQGVEHRLEYVRKIAGVAFYNNSKATSVDATLKSLEAFEGGIHLIMGGKDKGAPYAPLLPLLKKRAREVLLIGAAAERIAKELADAVPQIRAGDLATAVREAFLRSEPGDVVLLAPACSSFDQFENFEHRGRVFKDLVNYLAHQVESGEVARPPKPSAAMTVPQPVAPGALPSAPAAAPLEAPQLEAVAPPIPEVAAKTPESAPRVPVEEAAEAPPGSSAGEAAPAEVAPEVPGGAVAEEPSALESGQPRELVYVFEVEAKEFPSGDVEPVQEFPEDFEPGTLEEVADELMPYESRSATSTATEDSGNHAASRLGSAEEAPPRNVESGRTSPSPDEPPASSGQQRLPGVD